MSADVGEIVSVSARRNDFQNLLDYPFRRIGVEEESQIHQQSGLAPGCHPLLERTVSNEDHGIGITLFAQFAERIPILQRWSIKEAVMLESSFPDGPRLDDELKLFAGSFSKSCASFDEDTPYRSERWFIAEIGPEVVRHEWHLAV